jgi:hypothetical protein
LSTSTSRRRFAAAAALSSGAASIAFPGAPGVAGATTDRADLPVGDLVLEDVTAQRAADVADAADRYQALGVAVTADDLRVIELSTGDGALVERIIVTAGAQVVDVEGGQATVQITAPSAGEVEIDAAAIIRALRSGGPAWKMAQNGCFSRWHYDGVFMDSCYKAYVLLNEPDNDRNYYAIDYYGTAGPDPAGDPPRTLRDAGLAVESTDNRAAWHDWDPRTDTSGSCNSITLGVSAFGVGISSNVTRCETWDLTKPADVNDPMWVMYENHDWPGTTGNRAVELWQAVTVPQGNTPHSGWYLTMGLDGWVGV